MIGITYTLEGMGLFQPKPTATSSAPLYTLGLHQNNVLVGLGNPGKEYDGTRHNIGFSVIDDLCQRLSFPAWTKKKDLKSLHSSLTAADTRVLALKPTTYMNLSGEAVQATLQFYKIPVDRVVVIYDELDIPYGQIRMRIGGSAAGHNGVQSIIDHIGEGFGRVRIGIGSDLAKKAEGKDFVLGRFSPKEQELLPNLLRETSSILSELVYGQPLAAETRSFLI